MTTKTPYKELSGKGTVAQQAEEAWLYALSRYSSVVDETFAGGCHWKALADMFALASLVSVTVVWLDVGKRAAKHSHCEQAAARFVSASTKSGSSPWTLALSTGCAPSAFLEHFPLLAGAGLKALEYHACASLLILTCTPAVQDRARQASSWMSWLLTDLLQVQMPAPVNGTSLYTVSCACRTAAEHHHLQRLPS